MGTSNSVKADFSHRKQNLKGYRRVALVIFEAACRMRPVLAMLAA
jgi:hypothetical protein